MGTITLTNVGKAYKNYTRRLNRLFDWFVPPRASRAQLKWVIQDVSLTVNAGEALGIIGLNGAGKSTLLKMIAGTTLPSMGSIQTQGRIAAILELGMGFHPEFTGRQNVLMSGSLLGYKTEELKKLMPTIQEFAEIDDYFDQPLRVYSSGMQMRLAFSIATATRPDILIVDEALSVGDAYFQHKSFERIREFNKLGTTLLLVSHDKSAIVSVCQRAVLLEGGKLLSIGNAEQVMDFYNASLANHQTQTIKQVTLEDGRVQTTSGGFEATVQSIRLLDEQNQGLEVVDVGQTVRLVIEVAVHQDIPRLIFGYGIKDRFGRVIFGTNTAILKQPIDNAKAGQTYQIIVCFVANLGMGNYSIQTALTSTDTHLANNYEWRELALVFTVMNSEKPYFEGTNWMNPAVRITLSV